MRVVLGVSGGIAAYKAALVLRLLTEAGHEVRVVPTQAALRFVGAPTWEALSGRPVAADVWSDVPSVPHVRLGQEADLVLVAPATADLLARAAHGLADDLLTNTLLTARCPVVLAPAMHTEMWTHPATRANVALLRERGVVVVEPASGRLTGADTGPGRLPEPEEIVAAALAAVQAGGQTREGATTGPGLRPGDLHGRHVVVSAGGTREPLDPVRFLGNRSSGKQGYAVAAAAARRGARVTLVSANVALPVPQGCEVVQVETALQLQEAMRATVAGGVDAVVMTSAVADFRPAHYVERKIKKTHGAGDESAPTIELVRNPDILADLVQGRGEAISPYIVGFAAETGDDSGDVIELARAKLARKGCDLLVANEVGADKTFGQDESTVHLLRPGTDEVPTVGPTGKDSIAEAIWDTVAPELASR
ncbi:bifunctional phosphopantothenoylcysteine decarboxylase/phosphopantothenate--cysteine ligase CoaBC [Ornithinimicrobium pratense]|uniref:Coenzyme A biosynthesis bifunctional protein CoaBC n=1 Tax=Ornithinimicrobium pratense TaxID=2593973 RepID=A0A5J6V4D5_9MICO|nr:bifunctional phosphopantothenoylcysteine decarboxylase/phosphopantothenate--cysteine ligase CoaBC [Ornithinimicrobium pratense]QFG68779.1 bifunctional phosphopantothenoylcysteine decarboxylase/phosphopantothenate--cysteine ligase CoaBC [Ornithinimicrobium pratense]